MIVWANFKMLCLLFASAGEVKSVWPCVGLPSDESASMIVCSGESIEEFPAIQNKEIVETILIYSTFITKLPEVTYMEYPSLHVFEEDDNIVLDCDDVNLWMDQHPTALFFTQCPMHNITASTTSISTSVDDEIISSRSTLTTES